MDAAIQQVSRNMSPKPRSCLVEKEYWRHRTRSSSVFLWASNDIMSVIVELSLLSMLFLRSVSLWSSSMSPKTSPLLISGTWSGLNSVESFGLVIARGKCGLEPARLAEVVSALVSSLIPPIERKDLCSYHDSSVCTKLSSPSLSLPPLILAISFKASICICASATSPVRFLEHMSRQHSQHNTGMNAYRIASNQCNGPDEVIVNGQRDCFHSFIDEADGFLGEHDS